MCTALPLPYEWAEGTLKVWTHLGFSFSLDPAYVLSIVLAGSLCLLGSPAHLCPHSIQLSPQVLCIPLHSMHGSLPSQSKQS